VLVDNFNIKGLSDIEVTEARNTYGNNSLVFKKKNPLFLILKSLLSDPMIMLLLMAAVIYFITGSSGDGIFMLIAIVLVSLIAIIQDMRSRNALEKLKEYSQPLCKVIRNEKIVTIKKEDLVVGDSLIVEEGTLVAADGTILHSNDFSVNESVLTGESFATGKSKTDIDNKVFSGTTVVGGLAVVAVEAIGNETRLGKIGKTIEEIEEEKSPLELQINAFVKKMIIAGAVVFLIVWAINYFNSYNFPESLLQALTLAMSILPEEIPVALTTFMAMGAWRLMKKGIVVKQMKTVETLGSATVICIDKTGTITENKMSIARVFVPSIKKITGIDEALQPEEKELIEGAMWASEPIPFDPMEIAIHQQYERNTPADERPQYRLIHEYPLSGTPPFMTHIFENSTGKRIIAAKGAPEALLRISNIPGTEKKQVEEAVETLSANGYRVLAVAHASFEGNHFPASQQEFNFILKGIIAFYDPPKQNIAAVLNDFYQAGIAVKIITGDNAATTMTIARQVGFRGYEKNVTGEGLMKIPGNKLAEIAASNNIFSRMFPEAKLRIIQALKSRKEIVAMTGDGVNDGPALKAANIGIAMGKKGSSLAKQSASLILLDDDLAKMVDAIAMGRKIYANLKKAIQYIISIHIPIILTVFIPLAAGWIYPNIFSPTHIIFLELIMGPTCSIIYENEPIEKNSMRAKPRPFSETFFNFRELTTSLIQGLAITAGTMGCYWYAVQQGYDELLTRTMVFTALITANIFLTLVNRSFYYSILVTARYKNNLIPIIIGITIFITTVILYYEPVTTFFKFKQPGSFQLLISVFTGCLSVLWFEIIKMINRSKQPSLIRQ
jgi:Ca2+-transporting ATPase